MTRVEDWSIVWFAADEYKAPEQWVRVLKGKLTDGTCIRTAAIVDVSVAERICKTQNRTYQLGTPNPEYVEWTLRGSVANSPGTPP